MDGWRPQKVWLVEAEGMVGGHGRVWLVEAEGRIFIVSGRSG